MLRQTGSVEAHVCPLRHVFIGPHKFRFHWHIREKVHALWTHLEQGKEDSKRADVAAAIWEPQETWLRDERHASKAQHNGDAHSPSQG